MASLSRLTIVFARLSDHFLRFHGSPLRTSCCAVSADFARSDSTRNYVKSRRDCASPGSSTSGSRRSQKNVPRRKAKSIHCSSSTSRMIADQDMAPTTSVGLLSHEEGARSGPPIAHALHGTFELPTPLCERSGINIASLIDVCRWRNQAHEETTLVGSEFVDSDGGPEVSDLLRELEWLLDDAVAAYASCEENLSTSSSAWKVCAWRDIKDLQISELPAYGTVASNGAREDLTVDVSTVYGAFGALCKERHTDPVNEFAADCGCSCDGIRESLAGMASGDGLAPESEGKTSVSHLGAVLNKLKGNIHGHLNASFLRTTGLQLLLRMSIEELDKAWKERIQKRRPFQYVVAAAHWRDFILGVVEGVLIPRPETEQVVDLVESAISEDKSLGQGLWADLGTGSGAIAIAVARLLKSPGSVVAVDASSAAVLVARRNVERYFLQSKVTVLQGYWFSPLQDKPGVLAGVVSNPPYIPSDDLTGLQAEVGKHEPRIALDGGPDGMNDLRDICRGSATALRRGGFLALETNGGEQAESLCELLSKMRVLESTGIPVRCFHGVRSVKDFAGITRFVTATRC